MKHANLVPNDVYDCLSGIVRKVDFPVQCLYVEQEVQADDTSAVDAVLRADTERSALLDEQQALSDALEGGGLSSEAQAEKSARLSAVGAELLAIGAHAAARRAGDLEARETITCNAARYSPRVAC